MAFGGTLAAALIVATGALAQKETGGGGGVAPAGQADIDRIERLLQEVGFRASRDDTASSPTIESKFGGVTSQIELLNCDDDGTNCTVLRFHSGFDMDAGLEMKIVNDWNYAKYFGRAYLDEDNDPHIDLVMSMIGASDENIKDTIDWWDVVISGFTEEIDW
jgi:hypothetical protein